MQRKYDDFTLKILFSYMNIFSALVCPAQSYYLFSFIHISNFIFRAFVCPVQCPPISLISYPYFRIYNFSSCVPCPIISITRIPYICYPYFQIHIFTFPALVCPVHPACAFGRGWLCLQGSAAEWQSPIFKGSYCLFLSLFL